MALGFLKKVFSFGKKQVEEVPAEGETPADARPEEAPAPEAPPAPAPAPDTAPATEEEPARAPAPEEAQEHFEAPQVPEFLRRAAPEETPAPTSEREPTPETWDAPEPEQRGEPEPLPEAPEPEPVPEVPIETPDAPREEPAEPVARALREEAETAPEPQEPAPGDATPEETVREEPAGETAPEEPVPDDRPTPETPPAAPETVPDGEEDKVVEALPEPPIETPDAPHLDATKQDAAGQDATGQDATAEAPPAEEPPAAPVAQPQPRPAPPEPTVEAPVEEAPPPAPSPAPAAGRVSVGKAVERSEATAPEPAPVEQKKPWFQRLREGLSRSSRELSGSISGIFTKRKLDEDTLQDLEDVLLRADLGLETAMRVTDSLASSRYGKDVSDAEVRGVMATEIEKVLEPVAVPLELDLSHKPHVILVVGVNGTGKTTTIGKLTAKLKEGGLSVMIAAGDTFRAAAIEQLRIWGERTGAPVIASKLGADAAGLAWDAYEKAKEAGSDVLVIDTAGRLQNKAELMAELEKIVRVLAKHDPDAPHTVLQTVDATTGQNALNQVEIFRNVAGVNGLVMTKLDGTARGGILVAIAAKHKLPVYFIGVGEQVDDLEPFSASDFAKAIAGVE